ncbi:MAG: tyrosine-type recombinase/integrase [bacterium]|nr:tyrosine-type recombinase/integrase [bacterium]
MALFKDGNQIGCKKRGQFGPRIIKVRGRPGYYIRHYVGREDIRNVVIEALTPHDLTLQPAANGGLVVMQPPPKNSQYTGIVLSGDIIYSVGNVTLHAVEDLDRTLNAFAGKSVNMRVNKGGKTGTKPVVVKAGSTKEEAMQFHKTWDAKKHSDPNGVTEHGVSFSRLADEYLLWAGSIGGYSPAWLKEATRLMAVHKARWGTLPLERITTKVIMDWATQRYATKSWNTLMNELKPIKVAFRLAVKHWHYIKENPAAGIEIRKPAATAPKYLLLDQVDILVNAAHEADINRLTPSVSRKGGVGVTPTGMSPSEMHKHYNKDGTFDMARIRFLLLTGLRKSQFVDLKWTQYDKDRGTLTLQSGDGHTEKSRRVTVLPLPDAAKDIIDGQPRISAYIFPNLNGGHDVEIAIRFNRIANVVERTCGRHVHLHMLRHTALTHLLRQSQNIAAVSRYAGHAKVETTQIYAHVLDDQLQAITKHFNIGAAPVANQETEPALTSAPPTVAKPPRNQKDNLTFD